MRIEVRRIWSNADATLSTMTVFDYAGAPAFACVGLEDEYRKTKFAGETRLPAGKYDVTLRTVGGWHARLARLFGAKHRGALWVRDVPGFNYILIHPGNTGKDTDGCYLPGTWARRWPQPFVFRSRQAYAQLYELVVDAAEAGSLTIEFVDADQDDLASLAV